MDTWYKVIVSTLLDSVVSSRDGQNSDGLQTCSHEEADTQMLVHVKDTKSVMIRTVDTDIVVLTVAYFQGLPSLEQLWIAFATGKDFRYILIHEIASDYVLRWPWMTVWNFKQGQTEGQEHASEWIVVLSGIHRLRRNIILRQPWKEICMGGLACMARDHSQFCHPVIAINSKHIWGYHSETGTIHCPRVLPDQWRICMSIRHGWHYSHKCHAT